MSDSRTILEAAASRKPFLTTSTHPDSAEAFAAAHDLDWEVEQIANGKLKPGKLSLQKLAIVLSFTRAAAIGNKLEKER